MTEAYVPNLANYDQMVRRLAKPGADILAQLTPVKADLIHMAIGLVGEVIELLEAMDKNDRPNVQEELGDAQFFGTHILQVVQDWRLQDFADQIQTASAEQVTELQAKVPVVTSPFQLLFLAGDILNDVKGLGIYNKPPTCYVSQDKPAKAIDLDLLMIKTVRALDALPLIASQWHLQWEEVVAGNMIKLEGKRYKNGYSDKAAAERADKG